MFSNLRLLVVNALSSVTHYCVRWDSDKSVPATRREQIANDVDAAHQKWFKCVYGWDKFPFDDVKGNVVGWAVKDKSLLEGSTDIWRASASIPTWASASRRSCSCRASMAVTTCFTSSTNR